MNGVVQHDIVWVDVVQVRRCGAAAHDELSHGHFGSNVQVLALQKLFTQFTQENIMYIE